MTSQRSSHESMHTTVDEDMHKGGGESPSILDGVDTVDQDLRNIDEAILNLTTVAPIGRTEIVSIPIRDRRDTHEPFSSTTADENTFIHRFSDASSIHEVQTIPSDTHVDQVAQRRIIHVDPEEFNISVDNNDRDQTNINTRSPESPIVAGNSAISMMIRDMNRSLTQALKDQQVKQTEMISHIRADLKEEQKEAQQNLVFSISKVIEENVAKIVKGETEKIDQKAEKRTQEVKLHVDNMISQIRTELIQSERKLTAEVKNFESNFAGVITECHLRIDRADMNIKNVEEKTAEELQIIKHATDEVRTGLNELKDQVSETQQHVKNLEHKVVNKIKDNSVMNTTDFESIKNQVTLHKSDMAEEIKKLKAEMERKISEIPRTAVSTSDIFDVSSIGDNLTRQQMFASIANFTGDVNELNPQEFINQIQLVHDMTNLEWRRFRILLSSKFQFESLDWFLGYEFNSFDDFKTKFLNKYWGDTAQINLLSDIIGNGYNFYKSNKSLCAFALSLYKKNSYLRDKLSEPVLIRTITSKIPKDVQVSVANHNFNTFQELEAHLQKIQPLFRNYIGQTDVNSSPNFSGNTQQNFNANRGAFNNYNRVPNNSNNLQNRANFQDRNTGNYGNFNSNFRENSNSSFSNRGRGANSQINYVSRQFDNRNLSNNNSSVNSQNHRNNPRNFNNRQANNSRGNFRRNSNPNVGNLYENPTPSSSRAQQDNNSDNNENNTSTPPDPTVTNNKQ